MIESINGAIPLFHLFGIQVFLHWSWFIIALYEMQQRNVYQSKAWNLFELLSVFGIVIVHEFGHALACRSVGGRADYVLLWPLGGAAVVKPPLRPGAMLWSIAAGPLVNVLLIPVLFGLYALIHPADGTNLNYWFIAIQYINVGLLIFNMLPIYPLDGGQILWSLLWFVLGIGKSLKAATVIGMIGAAGGLLFALLHGQVYLMLVAGFAAWQCWLGFQYATALLQRERMIERGQMFHVEQSDSENS